MNDLLSAIPLHFANAAEAATEPTTGEISLQFIAIMALIALKGIFVAAEFALVKVRASQIDELIEEGRSERAAVTTKYMVSRLDDYVGATQFGITLTSIALSMLGKNTWSPGSSRDLAGCPSARRGCTSLPSSSCSSP